jgi:hypothetical protein
MGQESSNVKGGPTAPQSIEAQIRHQPTPATVRDAERRADTDAAALQRAREADSDNDPVACAKELNEAKHYWYIPA